MKQKSTLKLLIKFFFKSILFYSFVLITLQFAERIWKRNVDNENYKIYTTFSKKIQTSFALLEEAFFYF